MFQKFYTRIRRSPLALISFFVGAANWQLLFGLRATQWDMINFWLPWRHYIAQCYNSGIVPLWNPYSQGGYPIHGDLQGPAYSMEAILTSFISPINIYFLNFLYLFYLIVGAYGFYKLALFFIRTLPGQLAAENGEQTNSIIATVAALCFALCGYNSWHGHYLYVMISVCLLPWLYYYFFRILDNGRWTDALKLAIFLWWQVTAGNPSFIIVSFYFLVIVWICRFVSNIRKKRTGENKKALLLIAITGIVAAVLCAPVFLNACYVFPETSRSGGISLDWAAEENLVWRNVFALYSSLVGYEREMHAGADQPTYNLYLSIPALLFAFFGIVKFRSFWVNAFSVIAIVALLLSLGLQTPLYGLFYRFLPGFNVFRMPNLIIIYTLIYIAVMAALGMVYLCRHGISTRTWLIFSAVMITVSCFAVLYFKFIYKEQQTDHVTDYSSMRAFMWSASQARKMAITLVISTIVLVAGYFAVRKKNFKALLAIVVIDVCFNYNIGAIARVLSEDSAAYSNSFLQGLPQGFGPVDNIRDNDVPCLTLRMNALWLNASTFLQQPVHANDNNFELSNYMKLYNDHKEELAYFTRQKQAFLADSLVREKDFAPDTTEHKIIATLDSEAFGKYKGKKWQRSAGDSIICHKFLPHRFVFEVNNAAPVAFVLQQNYTKLWQVKVNGKEVKPDLAFYSFPLIPLDKGSNTIEFSYEVPYFHALFVISLLTAGLSILILVFVSIPDKRRRLLSAGAFVVLCGYCGISFSIGGRTLDQSTLSLEMRKSESLLNAYAGSPIIINTKDAFSHMKMGRERKGYFFNLLFNEDLASLLYTLKEHKGGYFTYICYKSLHSEETEALIRLNYGKPAEEKKISYGFIRIYKRDPQTSLCFWSNEKNFDTEQGPWAVKDSVSGNTKLKLMKGNEFGGGIDFIVKDIGAKEHDLLYAECEVETAAIGLPGLSLSIDREGTNKRFVAYGNVHPRKEGKVCIAYRLPEWIKETDKITVFYWNNTSKPAIIDNMKVQVIKME
jgi:hypothetical protein